MSNTSKILTFTLASLVLSCNQNTPSSPNRDLLENRTESKNQNYSLQGNTRRTRKTISSFDFKGNASNISVESTEAQPEPNSAQSEDSIRTDDSNNIVTHEELRLGRRLPGRESRPALKEKNRPLPPVNTASDNFGAQIYNITPSPSTAQIGIYAAHEVKLNLDIGGTSLFDWQRVLYSPTLLPPNGSPLEVVTGYIRYWNYFNTDRIFGVWDHTNPNNPWLVYEQLNQAFVDKYVRTYNNRTTYWTQVLRDANSNTWRVQLYNFQTNSWQQKAVKTGNVPFATGWDMHECYLKSNCFSLPGGIVADAIKRFNGTNWVYINNGDGSGGSGGYGTLPCGFQVNFPNGPGQVYYWWAHQ